MSREGGLGYPTREKKNVVLVEGDGDGGDQGEGSPPGSPVSSTASAPTSAADAASTRSSTSQGSSIQPHVQAVRVTISPDGGRTFNNPLFDPSAYSTSGSETQDFPPTPSAVDPSADRTPEENLEPVIEKLAEDIRTLTDSIDVENKKLDAVNEINVKLQAL